MRDTDIAYLAGLVDGEGCIRIKKSKAYKCQGRATPGYHASIHVRMVDEAAIRFLAETLGGWYYPETRTQKNRRKLYCYQATDTRAETILRVLLPYLRVKRQQAEKVLELCELKKQSSKHRTKVIGYRNFPNKHGTPRQIANKSLSDEYVGWCESLFQSVKVLNKVGV